MASDGMHPTPRTSPHSLTGTFGMVAVFVQREFEHARHCRFRNDDDDDDDDDDGDDDDDDDHDDDDTDQTSLSVP